MITGNISRNFFGFELIDDCSLTLNLNFLTIKKNHGKLHFKLPESNAKQLNSKRFGVLLISALKEVQKMLITGKYLTRN